jgi:hypothetical protein
MNLNFLGIGAGNRASTRQRRLLATTANVRAEAETEEQMRQRHADELQSAGYDDDPANPPPSDPTPSPAKPPKKKPTGDDAGDDDPSMQSDDELPPDDDPDPDAPPPEQDPDQVADDGEPDDDAEGDEDEAVDREPDETMRRARRARLRRKRRAQARLRERSRCAAIFQDPAAARNTPLAAQLAFGTSLSATRAIAILRNGGSGGGLAGRMGGYATPAAVIGSGAGAPPGVAPKTIATSWDVAMQKARNW